MLENQKKTVRITKKCGAFSFGVEEKNGAQRGARTHESEIKSLSPCYKCVIKFVGSNFNPISGLCIYWLQKINDLMKLHYVRKIITYGTQSTA